MLFFLVFCLWGPTEIPVGIHCLLVDVRCRLSTTTLVAFVPTFSSHHSTSQFRLALPSTTRHSLGALTNYPTDFGKWKDFSLCLLFCCQYIHFLASAVRSSG